MYCIVYPVDKSLVYIIYRLYNVTKGDNQPELTYEKQN